MKKIILIMVCLLMPNFSGAYTDVSEEYWAYEEIKVLSDNNIVSGYPDNKFMPGNYVTEEELVTIILRATNLDECKELKIWPDDYINLAKNNGIIATKDFVNGKRFLEIINEFCDFNSDIDLEKRLTRANVCNLIRKIVTNYPKEMNELLNKDDLAIETIIHSIEVNDFDTYDGKYKETVELIKNDMHPYLEYRKSFAEGNYILAIEFETVNNSCYQVPTSYESLNIEFKSNDISVIDSFDLDEVKMQVINLPYSGIWVEPSEKYKTTAFYILDDIPDEILVHRNVSTLYDSYTKEYVNVELLNSLQINL